MSNFDKVLINPEPEERDEAFAAAVAVANAKNRTKLITWPPADFVDFLRQIFSTREGMRGWHGGKKANYYEGRSQVIIVWWTDHAGRKHERILGGHGSALCGCIRYGAGGLGPERTISLLEHLYPEQAARWARGDSTQLLALCDCGAIGPPNSLGWMGKRCGS
jgi:hypothetical protein